MQRPFFPVTATERLAVLSLLAWCLAAGLVSVAGIWLAMGSMAIGLGLATLAFAFPTVAPLLRPTVRLTSQGVMAAAALVIATYLVYPIAHRSLAFLAGDVPALYLLYHSGGPVWITRAVLPFIVIAEELVWRGVVVSALFRRLAPVPTVLGSAGLYAMAHAPAGHPTLTLLALGCGLCSSALRVRSGSLIPCLICHLVWDFAVLVVWPLA